VNGRFGPNLADDDWLWVDPSSRTLLSDVAAFIKAGTTERRWTSGNGMPPMGGGNFSDEMINNLAAYILSL
jgi:mono/diheme cytochrome c family protein